MTRRILNTEKLYYGFPIIVLGYKDEKFGYNFTSCSSSYSLDNQLVIGLGSQSNAAKQIEKSGCFTLNVPSENYLEQIKIGGFNSGTDKFNLANSFHYELSKKIDAPIISESMITLECHLIEIKNIGEISHLFATVHQWLVEDNLVENEHLLSEQVVPVFYMGDSHKRLFRYSRKMDFQ
ncbi:flavin reductase family protein [Enterococcus alishanensis]